MKLKSSVIDIFKKWLLDKCPTANVENCLININLCDLAKGYEYDYILPRLASITGEKEIFAFLPEDLEEMKIEPEKTQDYDPVVKGLENE